MSENRIKENMHNLNNDAIHKFYNVCKKTLFPLCLILFALLKVDKGVDLMDSTYSLGNFEFLPEANGVWFLLTFISNVTGFLFTLLPFGTTMLGMKVYTSLVIAALGIVGYRFFMTKMPSWLAFIAELAAIGLCWCPSVILYHYLTYFFLTLGAVLLFRALAGGKNRCLVFAGISLGINAFVRFPNNGLEVLLILALVYYQAINHMPAKDTFKKIGLCVAGYIGTFAIILTCMSFIYGPDTFLRLIEGVSGISGSASDYTLGAMLLSILKAYWAGAKWAFIMLLCMMVGIPFFAIFENRFMLLRKIVYVLCIAFLFVVLWRRFGMFNFKYYQKESALQWGAVFLLLSIGMNIYMLFSKRINNDWKLIGCISLIIILITPLGSNNYIWPVLNNLFIVLPVTVWMVYKFVRWGRRFLDVTGKVPVFSVKAMMAAVVLMFLIQCLGVGAFYVFRDGEDGTPLSAGITDNPVLKGMHTTAANADNIDSLSRYFSRDDSKYRGRGIIQFGDIPGVSYILNMPPALNTSWPDLDSNPISDMKDAVSAIDGSNSKTRPVVILSREAGEAMKTQDFSEFGEKIKLIDDYIDKYGYEVSFINDGFVVYE